MCVANYIYSSLILLINKYSCYVYQIFTLFCLESVKKRRTMKKREREREMLHAKSEERRFLGRSEVRWRSSSIKMDFKETVRPRAI